VKRDATIVEGASVLGVRLSPEQGLALEHLADLLLRWNATHNLVSRADSTRIVPRHLLDSLSLVPSLRGTRVLDLGTGAGLPGLPLAIAEPARNFVLLDRSERKLRFARHAAIELAIRNVEFVVTDARNFRPVRLFDTVVARAVLPPVALWHLGKPLLAAEGVLVVQCIDPSSLVLPADARIDQRRVDIPGLDAPRWVLELSAHTPVHHP